MKNFERAALTPVNLVYNVPLFSVCFIILMYCEYYSNSFNEPSELASSTTITSSL